MTIESINAAQQVAQAQKQELAKEEEVKTQVQSKGSTKDVVAALGILASIGVATVAILKSKNAKKELQEALKKAEEEKKKLAEEAKKAAEDAKKAAEDINKKVDEAVNKAKEELKNNAPQNNGGNVPKRSGGRSGRIPTRTATPTPTPAPAPTAPHGTAPTPTPAPAPTAPHGTAPTPTPAPAPTAPHGAAPTPTPTPAPTAPHGAALTPTPTPAPTAPHGAAPTPTTTPAPTAPHGAAPTPTPTPAPTTPHGATPTPTPAPAPTAPHTAEPAVTTTPKAEAPKVDTPKAETPKDEVPKVEEPKIETPKVEEPITDIEPTINSEMARKPYNKPEPEVINIKSEKSAEQLKRQEQIENAELDYYQGTDMKEVARNILNEKPAPQPIDVFGNINLSKPLNKMTEKELLIEYNVLKDAVKNLSVSDPAAQRFLAIKGELVNKRAFRVTKDGIEKRPGVLDEYTREGLEYIDKQEAAAKQAIEESNARNAQWVEAQNAKKEAEYEQMYLNAEKEKLEDAVKYLDEQEAAAKRAIEESDARNEEWLKKQKELKQDEYEAMYLNAQRDKDIAEGARVLERGNLDIELDEVYPGYTRMMEEGQNGIIFVPRATRLSNGVQKVTDYVSEQWGKFRSLFGKKKPVKKPEPKTFEPSADGLAAWAEHLKNKRIEEGQQVKEQVKQQLQDNSNNIPIQEFIDRSVSKKHSKRYHERTQQKYDKIAEGIAAKEKVEQQLHDNSNTVPIQEFIDSSVSRKHNKRYHDKLQKEYDKMGEGVNTQGVNTQGVNTQEAAVPKAIDIKPKTIEAPKAETPIEETKQTVMEGVPNQAVIETEVKQEVAPNIETVVEQEPIAKIAKVINNEYQGLSETDKLLVELNGHMDNQYGKNEKRIAEIKAQLKAIDDTAALELTEANKVRIDIVRNRAERQHWSELLEKYQEHKADYIQKLEAKGLKPIEATDKEIELQVKYVKELEESASERKKGDIEWAERFANNAQVCLQELEKMGKKPIDRTTEDMQIQFDLFGAKNSINSYTKWIKECDDSIQKGLAKLKELLQGSEGVSKKNKPISEQKRIADGIKYLDRQEAKAKKAIEESNARNAEWLAEQNAKREAEYEKMYLEAEAKRNAKQAWKQELEADQQRYTELVEKAKKANKEAKAVKDGLNYLDRQEAEAKKALEESNTRNAQWLAEQNAKREAEYEKIFLDAEAKRNAEQEAKAVEEGLRYLDKAETEAKRALDESNVRNAQWVAEQNSKREADYEKMFLEAEAKRNAEQEAKAVEEGLRYLDKAETEAKIALDESNVRNAQWVAEQNAKREAEYEKMYLDAEKEYNAQAIEQKSTVISDNVQEVSQELQGGKNQLPESFNQEQIHWLNAHGYVKDNVTVYPKLYSKTNGKIEIPINILTQNQIEFFLSNGYERKGDKLILDVSKSLPKNEKVRKKIMQQLDSEHKDRRMNDASRRVGIGNESSLYNRVVVLEETKYNYKKYKAMEEERLTDADWEPEMTREEFMENIDKYRNEEFERTRMHHHSSRKKQTTWEKLKAKFGF